LKNLLHEIIYETPTSYNHRTSKHKKTEYVD
jgi:hypothetical protein